MPPSHLLAILLVTDSSKGSNLVFRWPPKPRIPRRLGRPLPSEDFTKYADVGWSASQGLPESELKRVIEDYVRVNGPVDLDNFLWTSPGTGKRDYTSFAFASPEDPPERTSSHDAFMNNASGDNAENSFGNQYEDVLGYGAAFLAELLSPKPAMCHQKFELVVDQLAFIGHPVHCKRDGTWSFSKDGDRGRMAIRPKFRPGLQTSDGEDGDTEDLAPPSPIPSRFRQTLLRGNMPTSLPISPLAASLHKTNVAPPLLRSFHLVLVLDRPDPSSVASTDLDKYIDAYYRQICFKLTAAMLFEQDRTAFVAHQSDMLVELREQYLVCMYVVICPLLHFTEFRQLRFFSQLMHPINSIHSSAKQSNALLWLQQFARHTPPLQHNPSLK